MASLKVSAIRSRIADAITGDLGPDGWRESPLVFDVFPGDNRLTAHLSFAVGVPSSVPDEGDWQGRGSDGLLVTFANTEIAIKFSRSIRAADQVASFDEALDDEARIIVAALGVDGDPGLTIRFLGVTSREVIDGVLFVGSLAFAVRHSLALA